MQVLQSKSEIKAFVSDLKASDTSLGLVPTMGALHKGHMALVQRALDENEYVVVSVFVNPTQFDNPQDLDRYPRTLERDKAMLAELSTSRIVVFSPTAEDLYDHNVTSEHFDFGGLEFEMEGKYRKGHFDGVGTVVKHLFEVVTPDRAYFGEKDFQQLQIVRKLVRLFDLPVAIVGCSIYREASGLAMSSRNERLSPDHRNAAPAIHKILKRAKQKFPTTSAARISEWVTREFEKHPLLDLEYFTIADIDTLMPVKRKSAKRRYRAFVAAFAGGIRLIDNIALN